VYIISAQRGIETPDEPIEKWGEEVSLINGDHGVVEAYQAAYLTTPLFPVLGYNHDDVSIHEADWAARVDREFDDPKVGVVGFGGATRHGVPHLYKVPYQLVQLARFNYFSNTDDAEVHGTRFTGAMDVAVLDGFALFVRRELLDKCNGWEPDQWPPHHLYDYRICAEARRHGYRVRMVGVRCQHHGGGTSVSEEYQQWAKQTKWGSDAEMHKEGHRLFYERYRDVMPWEVK